MAATCNNSIAEIVIHNIRHFGTIMKLANFIVLLVFSYSCFAQTIEWERRNGKFGTPTTRFIHSDDGRLYFGTANDGIACTADSGNTWFSVYAGLDSLRIVSISNDPVTRKLFCTTPSGNIYQVNPATGYCTLYGTVPEAGLSLIIGHSGIFYAWKSEGGIWASPQRSDTWQKVYSKTGSEAPYTVAPLNGGTVLVGTKKAGIVRSSDTGVTWTRVITKNLETGKIRSEINTPAVFALTREYNAFPGYYSVLRSMDDGLTWQAFPDSISGSRIRDISLKGSAVFMGGVDSSYYSMDGGNTWAVNAYVRPFSNQSYIGSTATFQNGTLLHNSDTYTMRSTNGGISWKEVNRTFNWGCDIVFGTQEHLYCISDSRMAYSSDGGLLWRGHPDLTPNGSYIKLVQTDTTWYAYLNVMTSWSTPWQSSLSYSTDQGLHWNAMPEFEPALNAQPAYTNLAVGKNGWILLYGDTVCVVKTADSLYNFNTPAHAYSAAICSNGRLIFSGEKDVYYTDNLGVQWNTMSIPDYDFTYLQYIPETEAIILSYRGKYSLDNGDTWNSIVTMSNTVGIYDAKYHNGVYYLATDNGLYAGTDLGSDIRLVGSPINDRLKSVLVLGDTVYVSGGSGIYKGKFPELIPQIQPTESMVLCPGDTVTYSVVGNYDSYLWSNGSTERTLHATLPGTYSCQVTLHGKTLVTDAVSVIQIDSASLNLQGPITACRNSRCTYSAGSFQGLKYIWRVTGGTSYPSQNPNTITVDWGNSPEGRIVLEVQFGHCSLGNTLHVTLEDFSVPTISVLGDTVLCAGDSTYLTAPSGYAAYRWSNGRTTQGITVCAEDTYYVQVTTPAGCTGTSLAVRVLVKPTPPIPTIIRNGDEFTCTNDSVAYQWLIDGVEVPGANERSFYSSAAGSYSVRITNSNGCSSTSDQILVGIEPVLPSNVQLFEVYPNPVQQYANIRLQFSAPSSFALHLIDNLGREVYHRNFNELSLDPEITIETRSLLPGLYHLVLECGSQYECKTLIIAKP